MNSGETSTTTFKEVKIATKLKLAALWIAVMLSYVYNDFFYLYKPGQLEHMIAGNMGPFPTTQGSLLTAMILMTIPTLMISFLWYCRLKQIAGQTLLWGFCTLLLQYQT